MHMLNYYTAVVNDVRSLSESLEKYEDPQDFKKKLHQTRARLNTLLERSDNSVETRNELEVLRDALTDMAHAYGLRFRSDVPARKFLISLRDSNQKYQAVSLYQKAFRVKRDDARKAVEAL